MGAKCHLPNLKTYLTSVYTDSNMLIWEIPSGKRGGEKKKVGIQTKIG